MISFAKELLCEVVQEAQPLLERHYEELTKHKEVVKLDPQWDQYASLERLERFVVFTARDEGNLVGYNAFFVQPHMHYAGLLVAQNDVFWLCEEVRRGTTALRFLRYSEDALKKMDVRKIVYHCKSSNNFAPILYRLGFADEEAMVGKII
jgi:hypothetical protein